MITLQLFTSVSWLNGWCWQGRAALVMVIHPLRGAWPTLTWTRWYWLHRGGARMTAISSRASLAYRFSSCHWKRWHPAADWAVQRTSQAGRQRCGCGWAAWQSCSQGNLRNCRRKKAVNDLVEYSISKHQPQPHSFLYEMVMLTLTSDLFANKSSVEKISKPIPGKVPAKNLLAGTCSVLKTGPKQHQRLMVQLGFLQHYRCAPILTKCTSCWLVQDCVYFVTDCCCRRSPQLASENEMCLLCKILESTVREKAVEKMSLFTVQSCLTCKSKQTESVVSWCTCVCHFFV